MSISVILHSETAYITVRSVFHTKGVGTPDLHTSFPTCKNLNHTRSQISFTRYRESAKGMQRDERRFAAV
ncbi:hypothetical protein L1887_12079 [Cichorium endivia]|nr:hypothetical protein L1887_12079 [Cichorium endivia]